MPFFGPESRTATWTGDIHMPQKILTKPQDWLPASCELARCSAALTQRQSATYAIF